MFQWYFKYWLGRGSYDDERQLAIWKVTEITFKGKLIKMIHDVHGRFDDYAILPMVRQVFLHWGYKLFENDLL